MKRQTSQKRKPRKNQKESDDDRPMKLRRRNQKQQYYESSQSDSDSPSPVGRKGKQEKKSKQTSEFKKGEYNHKIKDIPNICKQLQGNQKESYECCVRCANKELIRAVAINDFKMFERILKSGKISDPCQKWGPDNNFTILHEILQQNDKKYIESLLKYIFNKPKFAPEVKFGLKHIETGSNPYSAYGRHIRQVQVSRKGKQGNNAFVDDIFREEVWSEAMLGELITLKSDIKIWSIMVKTQILPKFVVDIIYEQISSAVEAGNYKVAGFLVGQIQKYQQYGYNILHLNALTKTQPKDLGEFKKISTIKKNGDDLLTPIHCAAINPNPRILEALLDISQEYSIFDKRLRRPIHYAAACETSGTVELLINKGVDVREGDNSKTTPLMIAAKFGRLHNLQLLLREGAIDVKNKMGNAALHFATQAGHLECVKFLLNEESNINLPGEARQTALHFAAALNHYQLLQFLLQKGAKIHAKDKFGRTPLILAARNGSLTSLAYLLQNGADYNLPDSSKNTPLHYASAYGFIECVELLMKAGADQNQTNSWNLTPLSVAMGKNHKLIANYFLSLPSTDINCKDDLGRTLISNEILRKEINIENLESLLKKKSDVNLCDTKGQSPLHLAASRKDSQEVIKLLLNNNIDVNIQDKNGCTAFICAINKGNFENAQIILSHTTFDTKSLDKKGQTLLQQLMESNAYLDQQHGQPIIDKLISTSSLIDLQNLNVSNMNAHDQLIFQFIQNIKVYHHVQMKFMIESKLIQQIDEGELNPEGNKIEEEDKQESKSGDENDEQNESEQDDDDDDQENESEGEEDEEDVEKIPIRKVKTKQKKMDIENEDDDLEEDNDEQKKESNEGDEEEKNEEINNNLLSAESDVESLVEDKDDRKKKDQFMYTFISGKKYRVNTLCESICPFKKYDLAKYKVEFSFDYSDPIGKKEREIKLKPSLKVIQDVNTEVIAKCQEIEKYVIELLKFKLPKSTSQYKDKNGAHLVHFVYSCYPKQSLIQLFDQEIVKNKNLQSQLHYFASYAQSHILYNIDEIKNSIPSGYFDQDIKGDTLFSLAAKRHFFYDNVDHVNNLNEVPLFLQIKEKKVDPLLVELCDPNYIDKDGRNGLHFCMMYNDEVTLKRLISKGANVQKKDKYGRTPLFYAFIKDNAVTNLSKYDPFELVIYLAKECNDVDIYGRTCLHYAAQRGSCMSARQLLSRNLKGDQEDQWGNTPLSLAFLGKHLDAAIMLIDNKYNITKELNVVDYNNIISELTFALEEGNEKAKIQKRNVNAYDGADSNEDEENSDEKSIASEFSIKTVNADLMNQIRRNNRYNNQDSDAEDSNEEKLEETGKVNLYHPPFIVGIYSFFRIALQNNWPEVEYLLLANGFQLNQAIQDCLIENKFNRAANLLQKATQSDIQASVPNLWSIFAKYGKDSIKQSCFTTINTLLGCVSSQFADEFLRTPLHYASESGFTTLIKYLVKIQININAKDKNQNTAFAIYLQNIPKLDIELLQDWVNAGCDISQPIYYKNDVIPPLIYLTRYKEFFTLIDKHQNQQILDLFLNNGCRVNDKDIDGKTLLIAAIQQNNLSLVKAIWKHVDKSSQTDSQGRTPLHYTVVPLEYGTYENIELLKFLYPNFDANKKDNQYKTILDYVQQYDNCDIKTFIEKQGAQGNKNLPRRAPTSVIANVDWQREIVDYTSNAHQLLNQQQQLQPLATVDYLAKRYQQNTELYGEYNCIMTKVDVQASYYSLNVFYKMQVLKETNRGFYILFTRWGGAYDSGQHQTTPFQDSEECIKEFKKIFKQKSGNDWGQPFIHQNKKYHLIKLKTHRNIQKFLKPFSSTVESKLSPELIQLMKDFSNVKQYLDQLPDLKIDEDSLGNIAKEDLENAEVALLQLAEVLKQFKEAKEARELNVDELERLGSEIAKLSNRYFEFVPTSEGDHRINLQAIVNEQELGEHSRRLNTLMNFEVSTKIFLGAQFRQQTINPFDYCLSALDIRILNLTSDSMEYRMIEAYAKQKIKAVFCVERKGEAQKFMKLQNRYLLWHGTKTTNFIGILSLGLKIQPSWAGETGARFGSGIYFADALKKSIAYSDKKKYLLLCEVALGKFTECDDDKKKFDYNAQYQSVKYLGQNEPSQSKCVTIGNGCKVPVGEITLARPKAQAEWNEYIVYSENQVRIRYLVQIADNLE